MEKEIEEEFRLLRVFIRDIREMIFPIEKKLIEINGRLEEVENEQKEN